MRNRFTDPLTGYHYDWDIGHSEEGESGRSRAIDYTAPSGAPNAPGVGLIRQQGDPEPLLLSLQGTILRLEQHQQFIAWWGICSHRTIWFRDFTGAEYEVIITAYKPRRERVLYNARGAPEMAHYVIRYTLDLDVVRVASGPWAAAT